MSSFRRRQMLAAAIVPGEGKVWERVQYISRSIGYNAIDLGIAPTANLNIELHLKNFDQFAAGGWGGCLFSTYQQASTANFSIWANDSGGNAYLRGGYGNTTNIDGGQHEWGDTVFGSETVIERRGADIYIDGAYAKTSNGTFTAESGITLCIGGKDFVDGCFPANFADVIVRTQYGSTILGHFIPVKILQSGPTDQLGRTIAVGAGCYYDLVTKQFYAATYGNDFVAGPAVPTEYINFADPVVEAICATTWGDGVGITPAQAAAVTNQQFGTTFRNNTSIVSFDELQYFTGMTRLPDYAFDGCSSLEKVTILGSWPLDYGAFMYCSSLTELTIIGIPSNTAQNATFRNTGITRLNIDSDAWAYVSGVANLNHSAEPAFNSAFDIYAAGTQITDYTIPEGVTQIDSIAFKNARFNTLTLPSTLLSVGSDALWLASGSKLVFLATTPPTLPDKYAVGGYNANIYVPYSADHSILNAYKNASVWSDIATLIHELNSDGTIPTA